MDTREVIYKYYENLNIGHAKGNLDAWVGLFADDFVMDEQLAGRVEGVEPMQILAKKMLAGYSKWYMRLLKVLVEGDEAFVIWQVEAITSEGVEISTKGTNFYRVKNGKVVYLTNYHDSVPFQTDTAFQSMRTPATANA
jgi:ketosteroid isomerase-like protein